MHGNHKIVLLMAEDDNDDFYLSQRALKEARVVNPLYRVKDGQELLDYLRGDGDYRDRGKYPLPGLVFLDLNMPKIDGREALSILKKDEELRSIPIVVLTTSKAEEDILETYQLGSNSYVRKPVSFESLVEVMKTIGSYWLEIVDLPEEVK